MVIETVYQRWAYGSELLLELPGTGGYIRKGLYSGLELKAGQSNWLVGSLPADNVGDDAIQSLLLNYNIRGGSGIIDKIGLRDGPQEIEGFNVNLGTNATWEVLKLDLTERTGFQFGLGVTIHAVGEGEPTKFLFTSIGLEFVHFTQPTPKP
jgi:hypothetical protein